MLKVFKILISFLICLTLCGCSTLSYVGEDYNQTNLQTVKTNEDFIFDTYKKQLNSNINVKVGISKTPIQEILALYVQVENLSYETPYTFKVEDLIVSDSKEELNFITTNNYLNAYQAQEANSMASMATLGNSLSTMTGMMSNYNEINQTTLQNSNEITNKSIYSKIETLGNQILAHSIKVSSTISPRRSQYFYFFIQDKENYPITIKYKTLNYSFML